ncbi:phage terminase small subunit P27 family [Echinicola strongylocentroti]|uniref:Phage terminase small subunit P27 family n=1 Tax=Echinicola strongylocentroti TaxID=1795355 RepID=A0A2Z4IP88_9BACT|nr:phage terminase small subunit P27 family [Echinicola strongylocentroti]AWW32163.1 phage terminase small subunit P27 family [Echinicola strongylocentroti]
MAGGRPRQPDELKKLKGTLQPCRVNQEAPKTLPGIPEVPSGLDHMGKKAFKEICEDLYQMKVITTHDRHILYQAAEALSDYRRYKKTLKKVGEVYENTNRKTGITHYHARPEVKMKKDAWEQFHKCLTQCGLTPSMRAKVKVVKKEEENPFEAMMNS